MISSIVATMDITKARDDDGNEITPPESFKSGFVRYVMCHWRLSECLNSKWSLMRPISRPEKFECVITARSQKAIELINQMNIVSEEA